VITDNGSCDRSCDFAGALEQARHIFTRPYRPQTNEKQRRSTALCSRSGLHPGLGAQMPSGRETLLVGFKSLTIIGITPLSEDSGQIPPVGRRVTHLDQPFETQPDPSADPITELGTSTPLKGSTDMTTEFLSCVHTTSTLQMSPASMPRSMGCSDVH
jgi:hypothetical protein